MQLEAIDICFRYDNNSGILNNINFKINSHERIGIIGPSGCGKSTLAKILSGYQNQIKGKVLLDGKPIPKKGYCPIQLIHQHPERAANPRLKMKDILYEGWSPSDKLLDEMGIKPEWLTRYPTELSGGELQRFLIARALSDKTKFLIADEISTMLDVITSAQIWNVLINECNKKNIGMIIVTHNLELAKRICTKTINFKDINN